MLFSVAMVHLPLHVTHVSKYVNFYTCPRLTSWTLDVKVNFCDIIITSLFLLYQQSHVGFFLSSTISVYISSFSVAACGLLRQESAIGIMGFPVKTVPFHTGSSN